MAAYEELVELIGKKDIVKAHKDLVIRGGNFASGKLCEYMDLSARSTRTKTVFIFDDEMEEDATEPSRLGKLFMRKIDTKTQDYGFVFNKTGTEKLIRNIATGSPIRLFDDFRDDFNFIDDNKEALWQKASDYTKRNLIAKNIMSMNNKTRIQYRTHGDRLHYLVIGKVVVMRQSGEKFEREVYPLSLFSVQKSDPKTQRLEIESAGFYNFFLDENILDGELTRLLQTNEISIDSSIGSTLTKIQLRLSSINLPYIQSIKFDPTFSLIGVITGFGAEYLDKAWAEILK
ncbi:hypothetical protein IKQ74_01350 [Candidatus Saccharibacteria bacterium]|nr:hypothetical protein [Candidatus Saccharibacteria bacterium]